MLGILNLKYMNFFGKEKFEERELEAFRRIKILNNLEFWNIMRINFLFIIILFFKKSKF